MERHAETCNPCLAQLTSPLEQILELQAAILQESEPLITVTHLLRLCRDEHRVLWEGRSDSTNRRSVAGVVCAVDEIVLESGVSDLLAEPVRRALSDALRLLPDILVVLVARGLAELVDDRFGHTFAESFRRRSPYQPGVGEPIPLDSPDLRRVTGIRPTSPPWRLANRLDETRRVRLAGEWAVQFRVVFDYSLGDKLDALMTRDTVIATCHPNRSVSELDLTHDNGEGKFPIGPADAVRQRVEVNRLIGQATTAGASIIVLPELCLNQEIALELQGWVRRPNGPDLVVAGSFHHEDPDDRGPGELRRRNTAIAWLRGHDEPLFHDKHSPGDRPIHEDIQPEGWPELRVYVGPAGWHLVVAICRDLLKPLAVNALAEAGANLVLVPAMSETLMAFGGPVAHLVGAGQAFVAVANNPGEWLADKDGSPPHRPARSLFGHPGLGQQTRFVQSADPGPGVALLRVESAHIAWAPGDSHIQEPTHQDVSAPLVTQVLPLWLTNVMASSGRASAARYGSPQVMLRQSAVLVLLSEGSHGPQVLLTERANDLTDYPGQIVFPGGAAESSDGGPITTALREAGEETWLDTTRVRVIGCLPPLALPDTGFIVHPVIAWSERAIFRKSANYAEVSARFEMPLSYLADRDRHVPPVDKNEQWPAEPWQLGLATSGIIDMLLARFLRGESNRGPAQFKSPPTTVDASPTGPRNAPDGSVRLSTPDASCQAAKSR